MFLEKKTDLATMKVYQEKLDAVNKAVDKFVERFYTDITSIFRERMVCCVFQFLSILIVLNLLSNCFFQAETLAPPHLGEIIMQKHSQRHRYLIPFSELLAWLKTVRPIHYAKALDAYKENAALIYNQEFVRFFSELNHRSSAIAASQQSLILIF